MRCLRKLHLNDGSDSHGAGNNHAFLQRLLQAFPSLEEIVFDPHVRHLTTLTLPATLRRLSVEAAALGGTLGQCAQNLHLSFLKLYWVEHNDEADEQSVPAVPWEHLETLVLVFRSPEVDVVLQKLGEQSKHGKCAQRLRKLRLEFDIDYDDDDDEDPRSSLAELHPAFAESSLEVLDVCEFRIAWDASPTWSTLRRLSIVANEETLPAEHRLADLACYITSQTNLTELSLADYHWTTCDCCDALDTDWAAMTDERFSTHVPTLFAFLHRIRRYTRILHLRIGTGSRSADLRWTRATPEEDFACERWSYI